MAITIRPQHLPEVYPQQLTDQQLIDTMENLQGKVHHAARTDWGEWEILFAQMRAVRQEYVDRQAGS